MKKEPASELDVPTSSTPFSAENALLSWMQEIAPYGIFTTDRDLVIRSWNQWLSTRSGLNASDLIGRKLVDVFPDLETRRLYERFSRALQGEISVLSTALHRYLLPLPNPVPESGLPHMLQTARVAPLPQDGQVVGTITIIEDVTQREFHSVTLHRQQDIDQLLSQALATLLQSEDPVQETGRIFSSLALAVGLDAYFCHLVSADGQRLELSASGGILRQQQELVSSLPLSEADQATLRESHAPEINIGTYRETLRSLGLRGLFSIPLLTGDRLIGLVSFASYEREVIPAADLTILIRMAGYVGIAVDRALRERAIQEASRAKDNFLAALSHELRTPLNPVLLLASDAKTNPQFPVEARETFRIIEKNVLLEARLIDDLLDLTRIAHGKVGLELTEFDLHSAIRDALVTIHGEADERKLVLRVELAEAPIFVNGDAGRLQQVFWNILKNAVKFTPTGGEIRVSSRLLPAGNQVEVAVSDTGIGMSPAELGRIFEAFSQGEHAEQGHRFGGLGLGLAITRSLVELHSGRIEAHSAGRQQGATILVRLPVLSSRLTTPAAALPNGGVGASAMVQPKPERRRILLIEDHDNTRLALCQLLGRRGFDVTAVATASAALDAAAGASFDLVLSDIGLPDSDGFELMQQLRDQHGLRGIALTGYGMEQDVAHSHEVGFLSHLTKPISMETLERALAQALPSPAK